MTTREQGTLIIPAADLTAGDILFSPWGLGIALVLRVVVELEGDEPWTFWWGIDDEGERALGGMLCALQIRVWRAQE